MPNDREKRTSSPGEPNERPIEEAVAACVERLTAGERIDPMEVLLAYPGSGHEVLERLESWMRAGEDDLPRVRRLGDFTLIREAGRGGMGVVYEAKQESMDRRVALKVLPAGVAADRKAFLRFLREAQTAGKLRHPSIVQVHAMGVDAETPYYAMEYVAGETTSSRGEGRRRLRG